MSMPAKVEELLKMLSGLLGERNVSAAGETLTVKPSSTGETASVLDLARREKLPVMPEKHVVGPPSPAAPGVRIVLSVEKMNKIHNFDRENMFMTVGPAVPTNEIIKTAANHGVYFPGEHCRHRLPTIGENISACFVEGDPGFKCRHICVCGLEMAFLDGVVVTLDGRFVKEGDCYNLPFLLAGHREKTGVITGVQLQLLPSSSPEAGRYMLAAAFGRADDAFSAASSLVRPGGLVKSILCFDNSFVPSPVEYIKKLFTGPGSPEACILFTIEGPFDQLDSAALDIAGICQSGGAREIIIAAATYQKEMMSQAFSSILAAMDPGGGTDPGGLPPAEGRRLKAMAWQSGTGLWKIFDNDSPNVIPAS